MFNVCPAAALKPTMFSAVEKKDMPLNKNINYFYLKFVYVSLLGYDEVCNEEEGNVKK